MSDEQKKRKKKLVIVKRENVLLDLKYNKESRK